MKDLDLQLKDCQGQNQQLMKLNQLLKEEISREKDARLVKDRSIDKLEKEVERFKEENERWSL